MNSNFKISNENRIENYIRRLINLLTGKDVLLIPQKKLKI